jgi:hypothetical protein
MRGGFGGRQSFMGIGGGRGGDSTNGGGRQGLTGLGRGRSEGFQRGGESAFGGSRGGLVGGGVGPLSLITVATKLLQNVSRDALKLKAAFEYC